MHHAVIMAGGSGTRFWPVSRKARPKQFLSLTGSDSLLRQTYERLLGLIPPSNIRVLTSEVTLETARDILPELAPKNVIGEPEGRDTAACVGYAAEILLHDDPDAIFVVLPADHVIGDAEAFRRALAAGIAHVEENGGLMTYGLRPSFPATGFGYLRLGGKVGRIEETEVHRLDCFVEKPDADLAREYLDDGGYLWNAGIFTWKARDLLVEIKRQLPLLAEGLEKIGASLGTPREGTVLADVYPQLPRISVDFGIMEKAETVWAIPVDYPWSDVGSWPALKEVIQADAEGNVCNGRVLALNSNGCVLSSTGPVIALADCEDLIVVATPDAVLVLPLSSAQRVKEIVADLEKRGWDEVL